MPLDAADGSPPLHPYHPNSMAEPPDRMQQTSVAGVRARQPTRFLVGFFETGVASIYDRPACPSRSPRQNYYCRLIISLQVCPRAAFCDYNPAQIDGYPLHCTISGTRTAATKHRTNGEHPCLHSVVGSFCKTAN